jgi:uncharacterized protein YlxW (UPF0749 family)
MNARLIVTFCQAALLEKLAAAKARQEEANKIAEREAELKRREDGRKTQAAAEELKSRQELAAMQAAREEQQRKKDEKVRRALNFARIEAVYPPAGSRSSANRKRQTRARVPCWQTACSPCSSCI